MEGAIATATRQLQPVTNKLYEKKYPLVENALDKLEQGTGIKREKVSLLHSNFLLSPV